MRRRAPRPIAAALEAFTASLAPATVLAQVQAIWPSVVGDTIAAHATPVAERAGVLEIACDESVWAAELELMAPDLVDRLGAALGGRAITALRCRSGAESGPDFR